MNAVENIERLIQKYCGENMSIADKGVTNNCIGALVRNDLFEEFKDNFELRLGRLSKKVNDASQRREIAIKIKNLAEETGYKWSGAYSELVALDFFLDSPGIKNWKFINKVNADNYPGSLAKRNGKKCIDIDFSFELNKTRIFTDIKSLVPTQIEVLDGIMESVLRKSGCAGVLMGVDDFKPESLPDFQGVIANEKQQIEMALLNGIRNQQTRIAYTTSTGFMYHFNISYNGLLSTMHLKNPEELAELDKWKYLNYYSKLLDRDYSFLTFVVNPWFNEQVNDFGDFNKIYYRDVCRRVFMEFKNDARPAQQFFRDITNKTITFGDISENIAGILFIEDKSIKKDETGLLYKGYLFLNPNYKNQRPLSAAEFSSAFGRGVLSAIIDIEDFRSI